MNTLYLPELREALATGDETELREFCAALHPARTAEFMEGLNPHEAWQVLSFAPLDVRTQIFGYFDKNRQIEIVEQEDRADIARLIAEMAPDDRVDLVKAIPDEVANDLLPLIPERIRRDIYRLRAFPEGTAGSVMTTDFAKLSENMTVAEALDAIRRQAEDQETIYYLYVVDEGDHLRGLVSARQLLAKMGKLSTPIRDLMETEVIHVNALDDQEAVAQFVEKYDLLAIPVVDKEHRMVGLITHDDVIDVFREEAAEDAHRIAAMEPLTEDYLSTRLLTLSYKRGVWLMVLFIGALFTAFALGHYEETISAAELTWLVLFIPLVVSSGGNSGSQSATLVITALTAGDIVVSDWLRIVGRELVMGLLLGGFLGFIGFLAALFMTPGLLPALVIPITITLVVVCGTLCGSMLPLLFKQIGWDPALMSNPFVAGIIDILGILIYMNVALAVVGR